MKWRGCRRRQHTFHWAGVFWNVASLVDVGATAVLATSGGSDDEDAAPRRSTW